jgi:hypothetical protein
MLNYCAIGPTRRAPSISSPDDTVQRMAPRQRRDDIEMTGLRQPKPPVPYRPFATVLHSDLAGSINRYAAGRRQSARKPSVTRSGASGAPAWADAVGRTVMDSTKT